MPEDQAPTVRTTAKTAKDAPAQERQNGQNERGEQREQGMRSEQDPAVKRVACIGGGTGLYTLLTGLKDWPDTELAAVVSMMDSGGSTGRLRDEFGYLPPGDVRQCLVALSDAPLALRQLMQHRFRPGNGHGNASHRSGNGDGVSNSGKDTGHATHGNGTGGLAGHVVGNILLTALKEQSGGDEYAAIEAMERLLRIRGKVYPVTVTDCNLLAHLEDGQMIRGETNIDVPKHDPGLRITALELDPPASIFERTDSILRQADYVIIGPGDLYTSIMPNLIVDGVVEALKAAKARGARIILVTNTMTKHGETNGYKVSDFLRVVQERLDGAKIDAIVANTGDISDELRRAYAVEHAEPVACDIASDNGIIVVCGELMSGESFARHHPQRLAQAVQDTMTILGQQGHRQDDPWRRM